MLVLTRKAGETIKVDGPCEISIQGVKGGRVTVGVTAPDSTRVLRGELHSKPAVVGFVTKFVRPPGVEESKPRGRKRE